jgi:putative alpha-1,2-mannosidase
MYNALAFMTRSIPQTERLLHMRLSTILAIFTVATTLYCSTSSNAAPSTPADYIDPMIGANTTAANDAAGKTFPGAATPFGLVQLSPDTITGGDNGSG